MARRPSQRRRFWGLERLEAREVLSSVGAAVAPTAQQVYTQQLTNEIRMTPAEALDRLTANLDENTQATLKFYNVDLNQVKQQVGAMQSRQPLGLNPALNSAAQQHSDDMANNGFQSHTGSDGSSVEDRMDHNGYTNRSSSGEDAYAYSQSIDNALQAFLIDWGVADQGHRRNLLQPDTSDANSFRDLGVGISSSTKVGPMVMTMDFGRQNNENPEITGAAFHDDNSDRHYNIGEGQGGVQITATNTNTGQSTTINTPDSGGYTIPLPQGSYHLSATINGQLVRSQDVVLGQDNIQWNVITSDPWDSASSSSNSNSVSNNVQTLSAPVTNSTPTTTTPTSTNSQNQNGLVVIPTNNSPTTGNTDHSKDNGVSWSSWTP